MDIPIDNTRISSSLMVISSALGIIDRMIASTSDMRQCIGSSVVIPGIVDKHSGVIHYNAKLSLINVNLKAMMEERYGLKVCVENDTNATVLAEKKNGQIRLRP